jgi:hypothetical protein
MRDPSPISSCGQDGRKIRKGHGAREATNEEPRATLQQHEKMQHDTMVAIIATISSGRGRDRAPLGRPTVRHHAGVALRGSHPGTAATAGAVPLMTDHMSGSKPVAGERLPRPTCPSHTCCHHGDQGGCRALQVIRAAGGHVTAEAGNHQGMSINGTTKPARGARIRLEQAVLTATAAEVGGPYIPMA